MADQSRSEHLAMCKKRAIEVLSSGKPADAWASFVSDMSNHKATAEHIALGLGMQLLVAGQLSTVPKMQKFIEDFN